MKLQGGVRAFQNNNEEYIKIRNTVEEKVNSILSDKKMVLKLALLSLTESMRKDPDKYSHLIHNNNTSSTPRIQATDYDSASYGQQQQYLSQAYADMLLEQAEKLYNKLAKELGDEIISDYASNVSSSLPSNEGQKPYLSKTNNNSN
jgi:predicted metal-dependent hydrolase